MNFFYRDKDKEFSYKVRLLPTHRQLFDDELNLNSRLRCADDDSDDGNDDGNEQDGGGEATVVNLLGVSIVVFVVLILGIVTRQSFR